MAFGVSTISSAFSRIFTRNYDAADQTVIRDFLVSNLAPAGAVQFIIASVTLPSGWLYAEGATVSKTTYPDLFDAIGYTFGGSGDDFTLPDFRNKLMIGAGTLVALGASAGAAEITITADQLPAHSHEITDSGHTHTLDATATFNYDSAAAAFGNATVAAGGVSEGTDNTTIAIAGTAQTALTGIQIAPAGGSDPVSILPPVIGVRPIIKV